MEINYLGFELDGFTWTVYSDGQCYLVTCQGQRCFEIKGCETEGDALVKIMELRNKRVKGE